MSVVVLTPYVRPPVSIPPYPYYAVTNYLNPADYNTSAELIALADGQMTSNVTGDLITLSITEGKYGYLFSPVSNGTIMFTEVPSNIIGGWDGIEWAEDDIGSTTGPKTITLDFGAGPEQWYAYRVDFPGIGSHTWRLTYDR